MPIFAATNMMSFRQFLRSLRYAFRGLVRVWREEQNFRLQVAAAVVTTILMFVLGLRTSEKAILTLAMAVVLVLELFNSAFERVVDMIKPRLHHYVEEIKDVAAGMVLVASVGALLIGIMIFWPYFVAFFAGHSV